MKLRPNIQVCQSRPFENLQRLLLRAHVDEQPDYLTVANLSPVLRNEHQSLTLEIAAHRHGSIYCMVIDGLADLISSANDEEETARIVEWAHRLAEKYRMVLISIVHAAGMPEKGAWPPQLGTDTQGFCRGGH